MPAIESIIIAIHTLIIGFALLSPDKSLIFSIYLSFNLRDKIIVKIATFINTYMSMYITAPLTPSELKEAINAALNCNKPAVIDVKVDPDALYSFRRDSFKHRLK